MPSFTDRQQTRSEELREAPMTGPWGGIQSELPLSLIEKYGVSDAQNVLFRRGTARARPAAVAATAYPVVGEPTAAIADFYNAQGIPIQVVVTPTRLLKWTPSAASWTPITGPALANTRVIQAATLNQKLCFTGNAIGGGNFQVMLYDGIAGTYVLSSPNSPSAYAIAELNLHLMTGNTVEAGVNFTQRYRWSGIGDPTDWTSFSSGVNDQLFDLGPVLGIKKLGQYGFGYHPKGIMQIIPTGIGTNPFSFVPIVNSNDGGIYCPLSLAKFTYDGIDCAAYVGQNNIQIFNQSNIIPIGDAPIDGHRRLGARSRIMADIVRDARSSVFGFVNDSIRGDPYFSYWLLLPAQQHAWVYHFDEGNWTFYDFSGGTSALCEVGGRFLVDQNFELFVPAIGSSGAAAPNLVLLDYSAFSEKSISMTSGKLIFDDRRHKHTEKKVRVVVQDIGACTYTLTLTNDAGVSQAQTFTIGSGSGDDLSIVLPFSIQGLRMQWKIVSPAGSPFSLVEIAPMYDESGEQRTGTVDGN